MATLGEIRANAQWFKHQVTELEGLADECLGASLDIGCLHITDEEWPEQLTSFREAYDALLEDVSGTTEIGYKTGRDRLAALASVMETTARSYIRVEAESEDAVRSEILSLLEDF